MVVCVGVAGEAAGWKLTFDIYRLLHCQPSTYVVSGRGLWIYKILIAVCSQIHTKHIT